MNNPFSLSSMRPNQPLRKPSSSPLLSPFPGLVLPAGGPVRPDLLSQGAAPLLPPARVDKPAAHGSMQSSVPLCHFCGKQGNLQCIRCKKETYCSGVCQTQDWDGHKQICIPAGPQPAKEMPNQTAALLTLANNSTLLDLKADAMEPHRVYLKDLHTIKLKGATIQASVVEFYNPGRFFLHVQNPELLTTLQSLSSQLQKTPSCPSVPSYVPCVGEVCAAQFSGDLIWYRGLVQKLAGDKKSAHMLYIDYGNEEDVPVHRMRPLPADIEPFHPCAMECCVTGVEPLDGSWSTECCSSMKVLLTGRVVTVRLVETLKNVHTHGVDIELPMGKRLSSVLIDRGFARKTVGSTVVKDINAILSASLENYKRQSQGKDDNTWAQPPEPLTQAMGDSFSVVITHFHSPDNMIVQKVENAGVIQELQLSVRKHCNQVSAPENFRPAPGTVCCAQFSDDKQWYRAKVLAYSSEERVCVGYIDFGNSEDVDISHLRPISASLLTLPTQAIPCGLTGIQPVGESWSEESLLALQRRVCNRILHVEIEAAHEGKALVAMVDETSDPQDNIAELLISAGYASPAPESVRVNNVPQAEQAAPEPPAPLPVCEPLSWSTAELPTDGQSVVLLAVSINNPGEFFCHIDNPADNQRLLDLKAELKQHCEADVATFEPKVGEPCCAMFPGNGVWYRAMVSGQSEDKVAVKFVDYGYNMVVERKNLRSITPPLLQLPFQAIRCFLSDVEPIGSDWSSPATFCFQSQVQGEKLSACAFSVTKQGYGVELECKGRSIAAGLVSNLFAKRPGEIPQKVHTRLSLEAEQRVGVRQMECSQTPASKQMTTAEKPTSGPTFPADWKTVELPINESFKPFIAAVSSPSLFFLLRPGQVDPQELQEVMQELAAFCSSNQATVSSCADKSKLVPGAVCCAQFTADDTWYRAVVVEVGDNEVAVIYADYGNIENLPISRILPIPERLLQLPFQIARCALTGKEHFPAQWPQEVLQLFLRLLLDEILATTLSFDCFSNILTISLPAEKGGAHLSALILDALENQKVLSAPTAATKAEQMEISSTTPPKMTPAVNKVEENTAQATEPTGSVEQIAQSPQQRKTIAVEFQKNVPTSACSYPNLEPNVEPEMHRLERRIEHMERMIERRLERVEHIMELLLSSLTKSNERLQI